MGLIRSRKEALDEFSEAIARRFAEKPAAPPKPPAPAKAPKGAKAGKPEATAAKGVPAKGTPGKGAKPPATPPKGVAPTTPGTGATGEDAPAPNDQTVVSVDAALKDSEQHGPRHKGTPLGELLVGRGLASEDQIKQALLEQTATGKRLGQLLVDAGVLAERDLVQVLAEQLNLDVIDLRQVEFDPELVQELDEESARRLCAIPIRREGARIEVAVGDPLADRLQAQLIEELQTPVRLLCAARSDVERAIDRTYTSTARLGDALRIFEARLEQRKAQLQSESQVQAVVDENAPVVQVVNLILEQAVRDRASDVHIEPQEERVRIRLRTDGALHESMSLPASMGPSLLSRIKVMADMNIVEKRRPLDGQLTIEIAGRDLDVRVSTTPTMFGEKCVLRLLDKSKALYKLSDLGMPDKTYERYSSLVKSPYGMVICAGPTGAGKTTTLYATLLSIASDDINVMTVEDPVEYVFPNINQIPINEAAGVSFANGLRSILRQDPDAVLVGEIRDIETARIAVQAALTGHFVMSSLHATDATSALHRFMDMGIEAFLIASSLLGVVGQRLLRRLCPHCVEPHTPTAEERFFYERSGGDPEKQEFVQGRGCNFCGHTGYFERIGIYEVLAITDEMRQLIVENAPHEELRKLAIDQGMRTLRDQAVQLVTDDMTTIAEVLRTVYTL